MEGKADYCRLEARPLSYTLSSGLQKPKRKESNTPPTDKVQMYEVVEKRQDGKLCAVYTNAPANWQQVPRKF